MFNRNIFILFVSQALGYSSISFLVLITGILSAMIGPSQKLATLPLAFAVIGTAAATIPAAMLMKRLGRKNGFLLAYLAAILGAALGFTAAWYESFYALCACAFLIGCFLAFVNQFRFAAIESLPEPEKAGQAVSFLLLGGVIAAFLGPEIAELGKDWFARPFAGSFLLMLAVFTLSAMIFLGFRNPKPYQEHADEPQARSLRVIMRAPAFYIALSSSIIAYAVMSFIMTATPISMHHVDGFNFEQSKQVIQWHIAAMFMPSIFNIILFRFLGIGKLMAMGALIYIGMALAALQGHAFHHYGTALVLLGIGWNFLFVAGTTLLSQSYRHSERFKTQASHDFIVFAVQGIASLVAGWALFTLGWDVIIKLTLPFSALILGMALYYNVRMIKNDLSDNAITRMQGDE